MPLPQTSGNHLEQLIGRIHDTFNGCPLAFACYMHGWFIQSRPVGPIQAPGSSFSGCWCNPFRFAVSMDKNNSQCRNSCLTKTTQIFPLCLLPPSSKMEVIKVFFFFFFFLFKLLFFWDVFHSSFLLLCTRCEYWAMVSLVMYLWMTQYKGPQTLP